MRSKSTVMVCYKNGHLLQFAPGVDALPSPPLLPLPSGYTAHELPVCRSNDKGQSFISGCSEKQRHHSSRSDRVEEKIRKRGWRRQVFGAWFSRLRVQDERTRRRSEPEASRSAGAGKARSSGGSGRAALILFMQIICFVEANCFRG